MTEVEETEAEQVTERKGSEWKERESRDTDSEGPATQCRDRVESGDGDSAGDGDGASDDTEVK